MPQGWSTYLLKHVTFNKSVLLVSISEEVEPQKNAILYRRQGG
jgi:hypothetical protein